jgi:NADPH-dependent curcumin reductase CurA
MSERTNRRIVFATRPQGAPRPSDFELVREPLPEPTTGQMLLRTRWLSIDPYMRSDFMGNAKNLGSTMPGDTLSEVVESRAEGWQPGDLVVGYYGWQEYSIATADDVRWNHPKMPIQKWDGSLGPASSAVGVLGMPAYSAYQGMIRIADIQPGETAVISAASGAVGQVAGQLATIHGARAVGIAGGPAKCAYCIEELGFADCVDYKSDAFPELLAKAAPDGIDVYFEGVGGAVLEAVLPLLNPTCRVPVCGWIADYNVDRDQWGPTPLDRLKAEGFPVLGKDGSPHGYRMFTFGELSADAAAADRALRELSGYIAEGKLRYRESITEGLDSAVDAFIGMLRGENFGKTVVRVA